MSSLQSVIYEVAGERIETRQQAIELLERLKPDQYLAIEQCCKVIAQFTKPVEKPLGLALNKSNTEIQNSIESFVSVDLLQPDLFTKRQAQTVLLLACGYGVKEVASRFGISSKTVEHYFQQIYSKFDLTFSPKINRVMVIHLMISRGIISVRYSRQGGFHA
jgi:DNA-binding NarL/FixJ family response regulator